jgi:hypothetical protein
VAWVTISRAANCSTLGSGLVRYRAPIVQMLSVEVTGDSCSMNLYGDFFHVTLTTREVPGIVERASRTSCPPVSHCSHVRAALPGAPVPELRQQFSCLPGRGRVADFAPAV